MSAMQQLWNGFRKNVLNRNYNYISKMGTFRGVLLGSSLYFATMERKSVPETFIAYIAPPVYVGWYSMQVLCEIDDNIKIDLLSPDQEQTEN